MAAKFQMVALFLFIVIAIVHGHFERIRREPEVKVYGLPKQLMKATNNAAGERVHLGTRLRVTSEEADESDNDSKSPVRLHPFIQTRPYRIFPTNSGDVNGVLERVSIPADESSLILERKQRSIDDQDTAQLDDLEVAEGKIFRPLFVYRQQVAGRHETKRSHNPIYGAHQYRQKVKKHTYVKKNDFKSTHKLN